MKSTIAASFSLAILLFAQPSYAKNYDPSDTTASEILGLTALSVVATPVLLTVGTGYLVGTAIEATVDATGHGVAAVGKTTGNIVKLVGSGGEALSELTSETLDTASDIATDDSQLKVEINKKEIPLTVRKDYLQLNQKVKTE
ncbi:MAG: hypothetical protein SGJ27_17445 [Candidatus Melainabacteria bacterium]|nr:hypothetical protein [Candidatus Melainabacteria bacterium]